MFQIISLLIALLALLKALTGLLMSERFYGWRQQQYASASIPPLLLVVPALFVLLASASWYATLFQYQTWGWVVTAFTTLIGLLGAVNLSRWSTQRHKTREAIATQPNARTGADLFILFLGLLFTYLAFFIF